MDFYCDALMYFHSGVDRMHGYWRLFHAYHYENLLISVSHSLPLWTLLLAALLVFEYYYFGHEE